MSARREAVATSVTENPDGSRTMSMTFEAGAAIRPVDAAVVRAFDAALARLGGEVMHAIDPRRIVSFESGGPPVWSVGMVKVPGERPYTLLMTYGFSHALSPEALREGIAHEYSIAVPAGTNPAPWALALLRHLSQYALASEDNELRVGDVWPCNGAITCLPFKPEAHAAMPSTELCALLTARDPVLPTIATPRGDVEVRRLVGLHQDELDRIETWSSEGFLEEYLDVDPLLLTDLRRPSAMSVKSFGLVADARARREGSSQETLVLDVAWELTGRELAVRFPGGRQASKLLEALAGRVPFGEQLVVASDDQAIVFRPAAAFRIGWNANVLFINGPLDHPHVAGILANVHPEQENAMRVTITLSEA